MKETPSFRHDSVREEPVEIPNCEHLSFALVFRGPYPDYLDVVRFIENLPDSTLIYRRKSPGYLWIKNGGFREREADGGR